VAAFSEQMQAIFDRFTEEVSTDPVSLDEVAAWAIERGLYRPAPRDIVKICRDALADSLRQEKRVDAKGRKYRAKHSIRAWIEGQQLSLWADIDTAPRSFMEKSFGQRRKSIVDDCFQIKQDVDHFNDEHLEEEPIQMIIDFTDDVAEIEAAAREDPSEEEAA
jgi:SpoVK/Ycf46/Vps4 family AAA+-type ATPase